MARYRCGPSVLQPDGSDLRIEPGTEFEREFSPEQERFLLACGAIEPLPDAPAPRAATMPSVVDAAGPSGEKE